MNDWTYSRGPLRMWQSDERTIEALLFGADVDQAGLYISKETPGLSQDWSLETRGCIDIVDIRNSRPAATVMRSKSPFAPEGRDWGLVTDVDAERFPRLIVEALEVAQEVFGTQFQPDPAWIDLLELDGAEEISSSELSEEMKNLIRGIFGHLQISDEMAARGREARSIRDRAMSVGDSGLITLTTSFGAFLQRVSLTGDHDAPFLLHPVNPTDEIMMFARDEIEAAQVGDFLALSRLGLPTEEQIRKEQQAGRISAHEALRALSSVRA